MRSAGFYRLSKNDVQLSRMNLIFSPEIFSLCVPMICKISVGDQARIGLFSFEKCFDDRASIYISVWRKIFFVGKDSAVLVLWKSLIQRFIRRSTKRIWRIISEKSTVFLVREGRNFSNSERNFFSNESVFKTMCYIHWKSKIEVKIGRTAEIDSSWLDHGVSNPVDRLKYWNVVTT